MNFDFDSTDRTPGEFAMFALAFIGFMLAAGGLVTSAPLLAVFGGVMLVFSIYYFRRAAPVDE